MLVAVGTVACGSGDDGPSGVDAGSPVNAPRVLVDRFSAQAGTLFVRDATNGLPAAGEPIDLDDGFVTLGLGPDGSPARYYNLDFQSRQPNPMYAFYYDGDARPVTDQLPVIDFAPGDAGYTDIWVERRVTVDEDYVANSITSVAQLQAANLPIEDTDVVMNRPVVPDGSIATRRVGGGDPSIQLAWYRGLIAPYLEFAEADLRLVTGGVFDGLAPQSFIFVTFNINPGEPGGGPASGPVTEPNSDQTHNVALTVPDDTDYSPLWLVHIYDNAEFDTVTDAQSATGATFVEIPEGLVNCPIVSVASAAN